MDQEDQEAVKEHAIRLGRIIDDNNEKDVLEQEVNKLIRTTKFQWLILLISLKRYEDIFYDNIGEWNRPPEDIYLKDKDKP